jgi:hypothetical protein
MSGVFFRGTLGYKPSQNTSKQNTSKRKTHLLPVNSQHSNRRQLTPVFDKPAFCNHREQMYPSQTKILQGGTKDEIRIFDAVSRA